MKHATGSLLLGSVAFSVGFVALLLGHSELFTEGFLVPVTTVAAGPRPGGSCCGCGSARSWATSSAAGSSHG